jgi:hypothetical protein
MRPVEVADTQVDQADRRRLGHSRQAAAQAGLILIRHPFILGQPPFDDKPDPLARLEPNTQGT